MKREKRMFVILQSSKQLPTKNWKNTSGTGLYKDDKILVILNYMSSFKLIKTSRKTSIIKEMRQKFKPKVLFVQNYSIDILHSLQVSRKDDRSAFSNAKF